MSSLTKKFVGDKKFYNQLFAIAVPIMIQTGFTNFVSLVDNLMVGRIGTDQMSGVAIVNQLIFVFNLSVFGGLSGAGIFSAQFYGKRDHKGVRNVFRAKLLIALFVSIIGMAVIYFFRGFLINAFLHDGSATGNISETLMYANKYLLIMIISFIPFAIGQAYVSTLRETDQTVVPMVAGILAVVIDVVLNYVLIFGKFGFPKLGVQGAAIATVTARIAESIMVIVYTHSHKNEHKFIKGVFKGFAIPKSLMMNILKKGMPLLVNEFLWSAGVTMLAQCISTRGLAAVAGINITNTIYNVFNVVFISMGSAISIIVGQQLGTGNMKKARDTDTKLVAFSVALGVGVGLIMACFAPFFPQLYNTTDEVKSLATKFILIMAVYLPFTSFTNASYFSLRSGGKTIITFLFDSCFMWLYTVPLAFVLSRYTSLNVVPLYLLCQGAEVIKCIMGFFFLKSDKWMNDLTDNK